MKRRQIALMTAAALTATSAMALGDDPNAKRKDAQAESTQTAYGTTRSGDVPQQSNRSKDDAAMRVADAPSKPNQDLAQAPDVSQARSNLGAESERANRLGLAGSAQTSGTSSYGIQEARTERGQQVPADSSQQNPRGREAVGQSGIGSSAPTAKRSTMQQDGGKAQGTSGKQQDGTTTYGVLVVPFQVASNDSLNNGCWARLYENPDFGGAHLTVVGPLDVATLDGTVADDWNGADSIVTGRSARVTAYDDKNFRERELSVGPGERQQRLAGAFSKIESLRVSCG